MSKQFLAGIAQILFVSQFCLGQEVDQPRPTPLTRPEMKQLLEDVKVRTPRIPLPELTDADRQALGDRADSYESRLRYHYLGGDTSQRSPSGQGFSRNREQDPKATLDNGFKVELFWIVSRINNCHYCLGHQESKLLAAGRDEDRIARLDGDWSEFTDAERAAFAFARKFTHQPYLLSGQDIDELKAHYSDMQILEMIVSMCWNNSINRWKEAVGVPQNSDEGGYSRLAVAVTPGADTIANLDSLPKGTYLTPTSEAYASKITQVAPTAKDPATGAATSATICIRPALETWDEVEKKLQECRTRTCRLPLASIEETRKVMSLSPDAEVPEWLRLVANFPVDGPRRGKSLLDAINDEQLSEELKAQIAWIVARQDRAWYVLGHAGQKLRSLGYSDDQIAALDGDWKEFPERERYLFRLAQKLAASPVVLTDRDVAASVEHAGPAEVVRAVQYVTQLCALDRLTEAAGLPLERS